MQVPSYLKIEYLGIGSNGSNNDASNRKFILVVNCSTARTAKSFSHNNTDSDNNSEGSNSTFVFPLIPYRSLVCMVYNRGAGL